MKKIKIAIITVLITMTIIYGENYIVKAAAHDSNPNNPLGNGSTPLPPAAGQQQQQQDEANEEKEKWKKRREFAEAHKDDDNETKKKYTFDQIVDYVYGAYGVEGGSRNGFLNKVDEDEEVKKAWRKTLKAKAEKNDGSEAGIILESIGAPTIVGKQEGKYLFKQPSISDSSSGTTDSIDGLLTDSEKFLDNGQNNKIKDESIQDFSKTMYNILIVIATFVAVLVGGILGVKIMISSADEKAQVKELLIPYVIGCAVVFGAFGIWKLVVTILQNM